MKKNQLLFVIIPVVLVVAGYFVASNVMGSKADQEAKDKVAANSERLVPDGAPFKGPIMAKVTVVEFLDPECESCRAFAPYVEEMLRRYEGKVKVVIRYLPLHTNSKFAVKILEAARKQNKFWETLDVIFKYQPQWGNHHNPNPEYLWEVLPEAGVDVARIKEEMNDPEFDKIIERDTHDAQLLGAKYTPSFFINGEPLTDFGVQQLYDAVEKAAAN